jgi:hypothetical protein
MAEVRITVECQISGQTVDFDYDDVNTVGVFIKDLQDQGMAWENESDECGFFVDGEPHRFRMLIQESYGEVIRVEEGIEIRVEVPSEQTKGESFRSYEISKIQKTGNIDKAIIEQLMTFFPVMRFTDADEVKGIHETKKRFQGMKIRKMLGKRKGYVIEDPGPSPSSPAKRVRIEQSAPAVHLRQFPGFVEASHRISFCYFQHKYYQHHRTIPMKELTLMKMGVTDGSTVIIMGKAIIC